MHNKNAPSHDKAAESAQVHKHFNPKSTATEAQRHRIIEALREGPKTSYDLRRIGIYQVSARIIELRRRGYDILTELVKLYDRDGYLHPRCARYHLQSEPDHGRQA